MSTLSTPLPVAAPILRAVLPAAVLGIAWNLFGIVQFVGGLTATEASLMARGLNAEQAALYANLPAWMHAVFAIGVLGGLAGSLAMALRRRVAVPVLATSLVAYVALFAGDAIHGLFTVMPSQLAVLSLVLAIAAGLLGLARVAARQGGWR